MSDTPRTDAEAGHYDPSGCWKSNEHGECVTVEFTRQLERELNEITAENTRLRAALSISKDPCVYCQLPKERMAECRSGFPGCSRADDMMGCPELGASLMAEELEKKLEEANDRIRNLIAERDTARAQADQSWKLREEFRALLGTDSVAIGVALIQSAQKDASRYQVVRKMNAREFANLLQRCLDQDLHFDNEVDRIGGLK